MKLLNYRTAFTISLMRLHRFYYNFSAQLNDTLIINNDKAHYIRNVLRIKNGRNLRIFNHQGKEYLAKIIAMDRKSISIHLQQSLSCLPPSKLDITLIQSISKGERMDYTIQKATELGINTIQPIVSEFGEVRLKDKRLDKRRTHWKNISISACEQSFRADVPQIMPPISLGEYTSNQNVGIFLEPNENSTIQNIAENKWQKFDVAIGPEGGWSQNDLTQLKTSGLTGIQFGQRILRTETMAPAILSAIHSIWGDFI